MEEDDLEGDIFIETPDANVEIDEDSDEDETGPGDLDQSSGRQKSFQTFRGRTLLMYSRGNSVLKYLNSFLMIQQYIWYINLKNTPDSNIILIQKSHQLKP